MSSDAEDLETNVPKRCTRNRSQRFMAMMLDFSYNAITLSSLSSLMDGYAEQSVLIGGDGRNCERMR
jgi:hypothetical protein